MDFSAARIVAGKEREWVGAASNQDGFLAFYTALNESISEKVRITSQGYLTKPQTPFFSAYGTASNQTYNQDTDITFENSHRILVVTLKRHQALVNIKDLLHL